MKRIFRLPDDIIDRIFEYYDPYKKQNELILYDLRSNQFCYHCFCDWFAQKNVDYVEYALKRNRDKNGYYLRVQDK